MENKDLRTVNNTESTEVREAIIFEIIGEQAISSTGNKFIAWKAVNKNGKYITLKFRRDVKNVPTEDGTYFIKVKTDNMNLDDTSGKYPVLWVQVNIEEIYDTNPNATEKRKEKAKAINEQF